MKGGVLDQMALWQTLMSGSSAGTLQAEGRSQGQDHPEQFPVVSVLLLTDSQGVRLHPDPCIFLSPSGTTVPWFAVEEVT